MLWTKVILLLLTVILLQVSLGSSRPQTQEEIDAVKNAEMNRVYAGVYSPFGNDIGIPKVAEPTLMNKLTWRVKKFFWKLFWLIKYTINPLSGLFLNLPPSINYKMFSNIGVCDHTYGLGAGLLGPGMAAAAGFPGYG